MSEQIWRLPYTAAQIEASVGKSPIIQNGTWWTWNMNTLSYQDTGVLLATDTFSNPNILDNWYFADPIDQRAGLIVPAGVAYYAAPDTEALALTDRPYTASGYNAYWVTISIDNTTYYVPKSNAIRGYFKNGEISFDRYHFQNLSNEAYVRIMDDHIKLYAKNNDGLYQKFEIGTLLYDTVYTCSILTNSGDLLTTKVRTPSLGDSGIVVIQYPNSIWHTAIGFPFPENPVGFVWIAIVYEQTSLKELDIVAAKLELGPNQTLAHKEGDVWVLNDPPPNKALELAKCQRYFLFQAYSNYPFTYIVQNDIEIAIPTPSTMRINPATFGFEIRDASSVVQTGFSFYAYTGTNYVKIIAHKTNHGLTGGYLASNSSAYLDANL